MSVESGSINDGSIEGRNIMLFGATEIFPESEVYLVELAPKSAAVKLILFASYYSHNVPYVSLKNFILKHTYYIDMSFSAPQPISHFSLYHTEVKNIV
jgi:hypothetical protein